MALWIEPSIRGRQFYEKGCYVYEWDADGMWMGCGWDADIIKGHGKDVESDRAPPLLCSARVLSTLVRFPREGPTHRRG